MINTDYKIPFYAKATIILIGILALFTVLYIAQGIIIPLLFALIIAVVLHPAVNLLVRIGIKRVLSIIIIILFSFIVFASICILLYSQANKLSESWPLLSEKFTLIFNNSIIWASHYFDVRQYAIHEWVNKTKGQYFQNSGIAIEQTLLSVGSALEMLVLVPIYVFLILFYKHHLMEFVYKIFILHKTSHVKEIITQTKKLIQHYIVGLLLEAIIVGILYATGLLIIGIDYALLLGVIAGLLNIIPYIGGIIILSLLMLITLATKDSGTYPLLVLSLSILIHLIDNSFIIPKIVASKVKLNALISITSILAAGALIGISGMIICIPIIGIIKLIFDNIDPLKPWGFLLGDTSTPILKIKPVVKLKKL